MYRYENITNQLHKALGWLGRHWDFLKHFGITLEDVIIHIGIWSSNMMDTQIGLDEQMITQTTDWNVDFLYWRDLTMYFLGYLSLTHIHILHHWFSECSPTRIRISPTIMAVFDNEYLKQKHCLSLKHGTSDFSHKPSIYTLW